MKNKIEKYFLIIFFSLIFCIAETTATINLREAAPVSKNTDILQIDSSHVRSYYTPQMKREGAFLGVVFSAFVVILNIVLA